jgi:hypothetical protein
MKELLADAAARAARYTADIGSRGVAPGTDEIKRLAALGGSLPRDPSDPAKTVALLDDIGSPATVATNGRRYFGFVTGGKLAGWSLGSEAALPVM